MNENPPGIIQTIKNKLPRREFLKWGSAAGLGLWVGWNIGIHEASILKDNVFVSDGISYFPMYETHSEGVTEILPSHTSGIYLERNVDFYTSRGMEPVKKYDVYTTPIERLPELITYYYGDQIPNNVALLEKARQLNIPIGLGDIDPKEFSEHFKFNNPEEMVKFWGGVTDAVLSVIPDKVRKGIEARVKYVGPLTRRQFLQLVALRAGEKVLTLGSLAFGSWLATDSGYFDQLSRNSNYPDPFKRLLYTLNGFATNLHPDDPVIFMRNILIAIKIKGMGEMLKKDIKNPLFVYNVGARHNAIEYLINLPMPVLETIFLNIHKEYLAAAISKHGENVAKTRVIKADDKGIFTDLPPLVNNNILSAISKT